MATPRRIRKPMPLRGRRTSWPADSIGPEYSPNALNVRFRFGEVRGGPGRGLFDRGPAVQKVNRIETFSLSNSTVWLMMLLQNKLYRRGGAANAWVEVTGTFVPAGTRRFSTAMGEDQFFFSRGQDQIAAWDGNTANQFRLIKTDVGFEGITGGVECVPAQCLEYFNERLVAANTVEGGITKANRIRWSQSGDYRKWDETKQLGAGFLDLNDEGAEPIRALKSLGNRCIVYRRHSLGDLTPTGTLTPIHRFETRVRGLGLGGAFTVGSSGQVHYFLANDLNVWSWDGVGLPIPVGDPVHEELQSLAQFDKLDDYYGICIPGRFEYWLLIVDTAAGIYDAFVYDYLQNSWSRDTFANLFCVAEAEIPQTAFTWQTIKLSWQRQLQTWAALRATTLLKTIGGRTDGSTMIIDEQFADDYYSIGSIVDRVLETEDMYFDTPWDTANIISLMLVYEFVTADPIEVGVSFDKGRHWTTQTFVPEQRGFSIVDFDKSGNIVRFRFRENNANGRFRYRHYQFEVDNVADFIRTDTA